MPLTLWEAWRAGFGATAKETIEMASTTEQRTGYADLSDFQDANRRAGYHFFDADALRFFRSKLPDHTMYAGRFFITSEQFEGSDGHREPRRYTVRNARLDGSTGGDVGGFQQWETLAIARTIARAAGDGYREGLDGGTGDRYGASDAARAAYEHGRALRRYEDATAHYHAR